jgi:mono/diheme cytochrome c family protein
MKRAAPALFLALLLLGCDDMTVQQSGRLWSSEAAMVQEPGDIVSWQDKPSAPPELTLALIQRGQQRFHIYCTPCHSELGDGNGMIVQRGFPHPPSYTDDRLVKAPTQHFYDVITQGYGVMYSYADRVSPHDRWAIAAYIRALQLSQHAPVADLTQAQRDALR